MQIRTVILASTFLTSLSIEASNPNPVEVARQHYQKFNYLEAAEACQNSEHPDCTLITADSYFFYAVQNKGKPAEEEFYGKCQTVLDSALEKKPQWGAAWARKGRILGALALFKGNKEKVKLGKSIREAADQALQLAPEDPVSHAVSAIWHLELSKLGFFERTFGGLFFGSIPKGDLNVAEKQMREAIRLDSRSVFYRIRLAEILEDLDRDSEALEVKKAASQLSPSESFEINDIAALKDALQ